MRTALRITIVIALVSVTTGVGAAAGSNRPHPRAHVDLAVAELLARAPRGEGSRDGLNSETVIWGSTLDGASTMSVPGS